MSRLPREFFYDAGLALPIDGTTCGTHPDCAGSGGEAREVVWIKHTATGVLGYCNRCGAQGFVPHGTLDLETLERIRTAEHAVTAQETAELPSDYCQDIPDPGLFWLLQAGIAKPVALRYGIGWSPRLERVVLPLRHWRTGEVVYWQARSVDGRDPKYLNPRVGKEQAVVTCGGVQPWVILTEDYLSAVRVGEAAGGGTPCLGTKLSPALARYVMTKQSVAVWLDPDQAGLDGTYHICSKLDLLGLAVKYVVSERDPKMYSRAEILYHLQKARRFN